MNQIREFVESACWHFWRRTKTLCAVWFACIAWSGSLQASGANFGYFWDDNSFPYDTEFSYFYDVSVYPEGVFADDNQHSYAYVTAQNKHIIYNAISYSVELVCQYGYYANNADGIARIWMYNFLDPARFSNPWIDSDADGVDFWELWNLDSNGYLVTEKDGHGEYLKFLEVQAQTIFISETTSPVASTWENRFYFFNFLTGRWDKKLSNSFTIPASREAVRLATYATGGSIWAGILETDQTVGTLDNGKPPVKNIVYRNRSVKVVDHGETFSTTVRLNDNGFVQAMSPYQLLYSSPGSYGEFVAGPVNCVVAAKVAPSMGGQVTGAGTFPNNSTVSLLATPANGWVFVNWAESGIPVSESKAFSFTWTGYRSLVANFNPGGPWKVDSIVGSLASGFTVRWTGWQPFRYQLQYRDTLPDGVWHDLGDVRMVDTGPTAIDYTDHPASESARRFYRVVAIATF